MTSESQSSDAVLMVRPVMFGFNPETAATNVFAAAVASGCSEAARAEFDLAAERLSNAGVEVVLLDDLPEPARPDAAFPNNWVSFHADGTVVLYPMAAPTRRLERRGDDVIELLGDRGFAVRQVIDLSGHEQSGRFLEGTGSMVLDRLGRRAYAAIGPRTHRAALGDFASRLDYSTVAFEATDTKGRPIYHTNVLLSLGTAFAVLCPDTVPARQRQHLVDSIDASGRTIIPVDYAQMRRFACNIIEIRSAAGEPLIAMSSSARSNFRADQLRLLESFGTIVEAAIPTIEAVGGGSLRCMVADIHLPRVG
jgi:hypothetical protein